MAKVVAARSTVSYAVLSRSARDWAFTVHTFEEVCTIELITEIYLVVKSTPMVVDNVVQSISLSPVTV